VYYSVEKLPSRDKGFLFQGFIIIASLSFEQAKDELWFDHADESRRIIINSD
jgi:hypothetical protein